MYVDGLTWRASNCSSSSALNRSGSRKRSRFCSSCRSFCSGVPVSMIRRRQQAATLQGAQGREGQGLGWGCSSYAIAADSQNILQPRLHL